MSKGTAEAETAASQGAREKLRVPFTAFEGTVLPEWIDANRHMTSMAYPDLFHRASAKLFNVIGIDRDYVSTRNLSIFQREYHLVYERELEENAPIAVKSYLIATSEKCIHHFHELWNSEVPYRAATVEYLSIHIDLASRRSAPFPEDVANRLAQIRQRSAQPDPSGVSRRIRIDPTPPSAL